MREHHYISSLLGSAEAARALTEYATIVFAILNYNNDYQSLR